MPSIFLPTESVMLVSRSSNLTIPAIFSVEDRVKQRIDSIIITGFSQEGEVAHQVLQTIGGPEYIYVFGDQLHTLQIEFLTHYYSCTADSLNVKNGYQQAISFYDEYRIKSNKIDTVNISFSGVTIKGLLVGLSISASAEKGMPLISGVFRLRGWYIINNTAQLNRRESSSLTSISPSGSKEKPRTTTTTTNVVEPDFIAMSATFKPRNKTLDPCLRYISRNGVMRLVDICKEIEQKNQENELPS